MGNSSQQNRICIIPNVSGVGGMVSFRGRLVKGLAQHGISVTSDIRDTPYEALLVIGGTRDLTGLWRAKQLGVPVIQRLDGMNWIHKKRSTGWRHYLRAEYGNFILAFIRSRVASQIIYQSEFSRQWWERVYGAIPTPWHVVYNGVDLEQYNPYGSGTVPADHIRILLVEGTIGGGYEMGLHSAIQLGEKLRAIASQRVELMVVGKITAKLEKKRYEMSSVEVNKVGQMPIDKIPELDRSAHVLYASDLNPACPNSVIEALACGLPAAGFDTGALAEIVTPGAGALVPYGGDPWKLEPPDVEGLAQAVNRLLMDLENYRTAARQRAEAAFGADQMVEGYLRVLGL